MSAAALALLELGIKYAPDLIAEIVGLFKPGATIDDAIAALDAARMKSYDDYIKEAGGLPGETIVPTDPQPAGQVIVTVPNL